MRDRLTFLWNLRTSPDMRVRFAWYFTVGMAVVLLLAFPGPRQFLLIGLGVVGSLLVMVASAWGLFHPRRVLRGVQAAARWAGWVTLLLLIAGYVGALQFATRILSFALPTTGILTILIAMLPIVFVLLFCYGCQGAAVCAFTSRRWPETDRLTRIGVNLWWLLTLVGFFLLLPLRRTGNSRLTEVALPGLLGLLPLLTVALCALVRKPEWEPRRIAERLLQRLSRYLTVRGHWRGKSFVLDMRAATLGLLVAVFTFSALRPALQAPGVALLIWMEQLRNQEAQGAWGLEDDRATTAIFSNYLATHDHSILEQRRHIALLDLDSSLRRTILAPPSAASTSGSANPRTPRSENAINALLIRRMHALGATVIVLTPLETQMEMLPNGLKFDASVDKNITTKQTADAAELKRSSADMPLLIAAIKETGHVVIALPTLVSFTGFERESLNMSVLPDDPLEKAAHDAAEEKLFSYGSVRLPVLPGKGKSLPVVAAHLYATVTHTALPAGSHRPSQIPIDFRNAKPDSDFLHIPASSLLTPASPEAAGAELIATPAGKWQTLRESVKGKIVFLDVLRPRPRETPVGTLPTRELLAYATATVLSDERGRRVTTLHHLFLTLLLGVFAGGICANRTPFEAIGRVALTAAVVFFASLLCYFFWALWLDAVVPVAAILLTYLLVTQLAFTQERERQRDLLKRFVAPQFVDAMLAHPMDALGLGGKLSQVCVLFADVRDFTGFAERHSPEEVFAAVNEYMTALTNALHAYGGVLDKYTGDGLMAWFPAEDDSRLQIERAVKASLAMRDAALAISVKRLERGKPALNFGIGLHYGEAMIGLVGNEEHQINYTALGHAVIVSARLQTLAAGGEVIISETVYAALGETFQVQSRDPVAVKGITELVRPYHVLSS